MGDLGVITVVGVDAIRHQPGTDIAHVVLETGRVLEVDPNLAAMMTGGTVEIMGDRVIAAYTGDGNCVYAASGYVPPALASRT